MSVVSEKGVMRMRSVVILAGAAMALASCGENRVAFGGEFYRANASAPARDRANFVASAGPISKGIEGAAAAAQYEAVQHCIRFLGTSVIDYTVPEGTPPQALPRDGDRVVLRGTCIEES
ncbi:hypothetical protein SAMN05421853_102206 [Roseivivax halotolerans]|uniref:Lipoprotein n=1 Tax=Roseivivax halotolerans TaxID=93684 RepID=A0A1I5W9B5_9RHOB|nr:hypothetical protein [Roseivivax halotolerans]SFQ16340.1 hypothetical protein SAMN05421853_102206 [Roseivivax halotolerans]